MKRWRKRIVGLIVFGGLLGLGAIAVLNMAARKYLSAERLAEMAEDEINSRVHIGAAKLNLYRFPATITLDEVALAPRDAEVEKPHANREAFDLASAPVLVKEVRLAVSLPALWKKRVEIKEFAFDEPRLKVTLFEEGGTSLDELLKAPGGTVVRKESAAPPGPMSEKSSEKEDEVLNTESLNVYAHGFLAQVNEVALHNGTADLLIEKTGMVVKVRDLDAKLDELHLDPAALEKTNTARLWLEARVEIDATDEDLRYAEIHFAGPAEARLFDERSGDLAPEIAADFELGPETYLNTRTPVVQKVWDALAKLEVIGVEIGELPAKATFGRSNSLSVHYRDERFTLREPISLWFKDWELALLAGTWLQTEQAEHGAAVEVVAEEELSGKLRRQIDGGLERLPKELRALAWQEVESHWFSGGRLVARLETEGDLARPRVALRNQLPDVKQLLQRAGERLLGDDVGRLLNDLLGN